MLAKVMAVLLASVTPPARSQCTRGKRALGALAPIRTLIPPRNWSARAHDASTGDATWASTTLTRCT